MNKSKRTLKKKRAKNAFLAEKGAGKGSMIAMAKAEQALPYTASVYRSDGKLKLNVSKISIVGYSVDKKGVKRPSEFASEECSRRMIMGLKRMDRKSLRDNLQRI